MINLVNGIIRKLSCSLAVFLFCSMLLYALSITAHAETLLNATAEIQFTTKAVGVDETSEAFTFVLEAADKDAPMPDGAELTITGTGAAGFFITYDQVGEYTYRLYEESGMADRWTYDDTVYTVRVYVLWDEDTNSLESYVIYYDGEGYKTQAVFINTYEPEIVTPTPTLSPTPTPARSTPRTGDNSNIRLFAVIESLCLLIFLCLLAKRRRTQRS